MPGCHIFSGVLLGPTPATGDGQRVDCLVVAAHDRCRAAEGSGVKAADHITTAQGANSRGAGRSASL
jgi:hypothetical protein